jgi:hypothetical protein
MCGQRIIRGARMTLDMLEVVLAFALGCVISGALGFVLNR